MIEGDRRVDRNSGSFRRFDEHVHLLADINRKLTTVKTVDDLQHTRIHPLRGVAGERRFGNDERLKPHKFQWRLDVPVAAQEPHCRRAGLYPPGVVFIHVHAHAQRINAAQQNQRLRQNSGLGKFPKTHFEL